MVRFRLVLAVAAVSVFTLGMGAALAQQSSNPEASVTAEAKADKGTADPNKGCDTDGYSNQGGGQEKKDGCVEPTVSVPPEETEPTASVPPEECPDVVARTGTTPPECEPTGSVPPEETEPTASVPPEETEPTASVPPEETEPTASVPPEETEPTASVPPEETEPTASAPPEQTTTRPPNPGRGNPDNPGGQVIVFNPPNRPDITIVINDRDENVLYLTLDGQRFSVPRTDLDRDGSFSDTEDGAMVAAAATEDAGFVSDQYGLPREQGVTAVNAATKLPDTGGPDLQNLLLAGLVAVFGSGLLVWRSMVRT